MADRQQDILDAARDLFLQGGVEAMTMRAVGRAVGVSAAAIYRHFRDKDALLEAVVAQGRDRFAASLFAALAGTDARDRLVRTGLGYVGFALDEPEHFRVFFLSGPHLAPPSSDTPPLRGPTDRPPPARQFLLDRLQECASEGILRSDRSVDEFALFLWAEVHGLATMWVAGGLRGRMPRPTFEHLVRGCVSCAVDRVLTHPV